MLWYQLEEEEKASIKEKINHGALVDPSSHMGKIANINKNSAEPLNV